MHRIVTAAEMRQLDQFTIEEVGIPGIVLMERAGQFAYLVARDILADRESPLVYVFCGKGNNGGDGLVVARYLAMADIEVRIICVAHPEEMTGDAATNLQIVQRLGIPIEFARSVVRVENILQVTPDLIVDAILGTGIEGKVRGRLKQVIEVINKYSNCPVLSIDIPSGLIADQTDLPEVCIYADVTVAMGMYKRCHVVYPARMACGEVMVADIGFPPESMLSLPSSVVLMEKEEFFLPIRGEMVHKYSAGKVAVLAGSPGYTGAAALAAQAAAKIGAGLVILGIPESLNPVLEQKLTEVITRPLPETDQHTLGRNSLPAVQELLDWCDVLIIGPGLGRGKEVQETVLEILTDFSKPAVVDADALFALAMHPEVFQRLRRPNWVLTPHDGEFLRFFPGMEKAELYQHRIDIAREFASGHAVILNLKSATSLVATPEGKVYVNHTGNSALAKGGTGDVLCGWIGGLLHFFNEDPELAPIMANLLQGHIADYYVRKHDPNTFMAGDLLTYLEEALQDLMRNSADPDKE